MLNFKDFIKTKHECDEKSKNIIMGNLIGRSRPIGKKAKMNFWEGNWSNKGK